MADYKTLHGSNIEVVASDPSNPINGQVWYNTTSNVMKGFTSNATGAWASGGNINTARHLVGEAGIQTAALIFGGQPNPAKDETESYNGSTWTEVGDLNTARNGIGSAGTNTSALGFGGEPGTVNTESWNATSWTEVANLPANKQNSGSCGASNTSALFFGGAGNVTTNTSWNGSAWTELADLNTGRANLTGAGIVTAALATGGYINTLSANSALNEQWNGTSWSEVADLNSARRLISCSCAGSTTAAVAFGGYTTADSALTETWNGTSWTEVADLSVARYGGGGCGTQGSALLAGGYSDAVTNSVSTEEWTEPITATVTFDATDV